MFQQTIQNNQQLNNDRIKINKPSRTSAQQKKNNWHKQTEQTNAVYSLFEFRYIPLFQKLNRNINFEPRTKHAIHCIDEILFDIFTMEISQCFDKITSANACC